MADAYGREERWGEEWLSPLLKYAAHISGGINSFLPDPLGLRQYNLFNQIENALYPDLDVTDADTSLDMANSIVDANTATAKELAAINFENEMTAAREANRFSAEQAEINRRFQAQQIEQANRFSADQAQLNRDFINSQRSTSYQTAVQDLRQAGLNPALLYANGGAGAPTVSGAVSAGAYAAGSSASGLKATSQMASVDLNSYKDILSALISSASSMKNTNTYAGAMMASAVLGSAGDLLKNIPIKKNPIGFR